MSDGKTNTAAVPVDLSRIGPSLASYSPGVRREAIDAIHRIKARVQESMVYASPDSGLDVVEREGIFNIHYVAFDDCIVILEIGTEIAPPAGKLEAFLVKRGDVIIAMRAHDRGDGPSAQLEVLDGDHRLCAIDSLHVGAGIRVDAPIEFDGSVLSEETGNFASTAALFELFESRAAASIGSRNDTVKCTASDGGSCFAGAPRGTIIVDTALVGGAVRSAGIAAAITLGVDNPAHVSSQSTVLHAFFERGEAVRNMVLDEHLRRFGTFTEDLELRAVVPACLRLRLADVQIAVPHLLALTSIEWLSTSLCLPTINLQQVTGVIPCLSLQSAFLHVLQIIKTSLAPEQQRLANMLFSCPSETLITGVLTNMPRDKQVMQRTCDERSEHALDEAFHHAILAQIIGVMWEQLSSEYRYFAAPFLTPLIVALLGVDALTELNGLETIGFAAHEARRIAEYTGEEDEAETHGLLSKGFCHPSCRRTI